MHTHTQSDAAPAITIRPLSPGEDATAFRTLNEEWITRWFSLEQTDRDTLGDPGIHIFARGGHILMAYADGVPVATVALIPFGHGSYELSKMAVSPTLRGLGIGRMLIEHTIAFARQIGAISLFLGSSTRLVNAVRLYESVGFRHVPSASLPGIHYARADVFMKLDFECPEAYGVSPEGVKLDTDVHAGSSQGKRH